MRKLFLIFSLLLLAPNVFARTVKPKSHPTDSTSFDSVAVDSMLKFLDSISSPTQDVLYIDNWISIVPTPTIDTVVLLFFSDGRIEQIEYPQTIYQSEYEICKRRGHESRGVALANSLYTTYTCKWCETNYRIENIHRIIECNNWGGEIRK